MEMHLDDVEERNLDLVPMSDLVDAYILSSNLKSSTDDFRKEVGNKIEERMDGKRAEGRLGRVSRVEVQKWNLEDEDFVVDRMEQAGVPRGDIMSVDSDKVEDVVDANPRVNKGEVFDSYSYSYVKKSGVDDVELQEMVEECGGIDDPEARDACIADFAGD